MQNIFLETLAWISAKLDKLGIAYMVTGGSALSFWGHVRTTMDIDIVVQISPSRIPELIAAVKDESYIDEDDVRLAVSEKRMFNVIFNATVFKVDFAVLDDTKPYQKESFSRRKEFELAGQPLWVITAEDLVLSKLRWMKSAGGSERQLQDCRSIMELNKGMLDTKYMEKWASVLGISDEIKLL
ncbi:MAG: nucleotidyl transferase AbiEii/AbiGii toxin family protein [Elusimicrobia bacterium]|nr:nucleotidyl transferase AbiEii/AbiGii toxin family protein [Elusimicrobiota bacterium]